MNSVAQVSEPSIGSLAVTILDPRVIVARGNNFARDTDPVLRAAVLEGNARRLVVLNVLEFLGVVVGNEEAAETAELALLYLVLWSCHKIIVIGQHISFLRRFAHE